MRYVFHNLLNLLSKCLYTSISRGILQKGDCVGSDDSLGAYFEGFLNKKSLFKNKKVLLSNYCPDTIEYREEHMRSVAQVLAPVLKGDKPSNLFIYGKTGTGKTLVVQHTRAELERVAQARSLPLKFVYLNCKLKRVADTEYRLIAEIARHLGKTIPPTGLPTDEVYNIFYRALEHLDYVLLLILDEVDQLVGKAGDELLYNLTRINSTLEHAQVSLVGISNDVRFIDYLDPRVKSSLSEEEVVFSPYNALQLQGILNTRARLAFTTHGVGEGVIPKCAAIAAREHGDARRAIELLRVAGELAERENHEQVTLEHLNSAEHTIERDRVVDLIKTQPLQYQATLYAILSLSERRDSAIFTGDIYDYYSTLCAHTHMRPLTQRRISDILAEFDMSGVITAKIISKGRYGRTREVSVSLPQKTHHKIKQLLSEALNLS